jgi:hypothetical protein
MLCRPSSFCNHPDQVGTHHLIVLIIPVWKLDHLAVSFPQAYYVGVCKTLCICSFHRRFLECVNIVARGYKANSKYLTSFASQRISRFQKLLRDKIITDLFIRHIRLLKPYRISSISLHKKGCVVCSHSGNIDQSVVYAPGDSEEQDPGCEHSHVA